ncbi:unnamed protein product [Sphagnum balticum]
MKGQKQAVLEAVQRMLPNFNLYKDIALVMLTKTQLESLKFEIGSDISNGYIEYSKDSNNGPEVFAYARSMVMNHLKKAKELNGNQIYGVGPAAVQPRPPKALEGLNKEILPEELREFISSLV